MLNLFFSSNIALVMLLEIRYDILVGRVDCFSELHRCAVVLKVGVHSFLLIQLSLSDSNVNKSIYYYNLNSYLIFQIDLIVQNKKIMYKPKFTINFLPQEIQKKRQVYNNQMSNKDPKYQSQQHNTNKSPDKDIIPKIQPDNYPQKPLNQKQSTHNFLNPQSPNNGYFQQISQQQSFNFPISESDHIKEIYSSASFSESPIDRLKERHLMESSNPFQKTVDYELKLSQRQASNLNEEYRKKREKYADYKTPVDSYQNENPDGSYNKTHNFLQELQQSAPSGIEKQYLNRKLSLSPEKKVGSFSNKNKQNLTENQSKVSIKSDNNDNQPKLEGQRKQTSITFPKKEEDQLFSQDQIDLKKEFIFFLILTFFFLHLFYGIEYKLEYFTIMNLFLLFLWITISPHFQQKFIITTENKQLHKMLFEFIKSRYYHTNITKPIFKLIFCNLFAIDLGLLKIAIGKLGFFQSQVQNSPIFKGFLQNYVDMNFINILEKVLVQTWNFLINGFNRNENDQANQGQFFLLKIFHFLTKIFYWIFVILSAIFNLLSSFFTEFVLNGQYFIYLVLIILCGVIAFKSFFKISQNVQKVIASTVSEKFQKMTKKQEVGIIEKNEKQLPLLSRKSEGKSKIQKKQLTSVYKKKRKSSMGSNSSQVEVYNMMRNSQQAQQHPAYQQFSKYLLIFSLVFIYGFCYFAEDNYKFLFFQSISVKQVWSVFLCLYSFLIVENCQKNQQFGQRTNSDEKWFRLKLYASTFLAIILILHDLVVSKTQCQTKSFAIDFVQTVQCLNSQSNYKYSFDDIFFNCHISQNVLSENKFRLNILLEYVMKFIIILNFRFHKFYLLERKKSYFTPEQQSKLIEDDKSQGQNVNQSEIFGISQSMVGISTQSYKLRKKVAKITKKLQQNTLALLILTVLIMTLTNSISNIIILIGTFMNIPLFRDSSFRNFLMVGLSLGLILQPNQLLYFVLLIFMIYVRGQDMDFKMHSHWILIQFTQLYIMFSKVSVINFLMGLMPSGTLVMYCIGFRIIFNYFSWISVFMGTEDNYTKSYFYNLIPNSFFVDVSLWIFMILIKTYAANLTNKFPNSNITNIFKQYPVIEKIEPVLKLFKIIQLLSYVSIELIVFTQTPSIIIFTRIFLHFIIVAVDLAFEKANQTLKNLWIANFYVSLFIAFLKYFYLLNRYENLSNWLVALLQPLQSNWSIIGLWPLQKIQSPLTLIVLFLPDFCIVILSMLVKYSLQVKIFESYRQIFEKKQQKAERQKSSSSDNNHSIKAQSQQQVLQFEHIDVESKKQPAVFILPPPKQQKDIQYLYKNYIKEHKFKLTPTSMLGKLLADFFYDIYFLLVCAVYFLLQDTNSFAGFWLNMPHFIIAFVIFIHQQDRRLPKMTFLYSTMYSCATLLLLYIKYLYSYVTLQSNGEGSYFYNLSDILNKYIFFLLGCLFYKLHDDLFEQLQMPKNTHHHQRRRNMLYTFIIPTFDKKFSNIFIKEITILWVNFFKSAILAIFIANSFTSVQNAIFNFLMGIYLLIILVFPRHLGFHNEEHILQHYWVYPFLLSFCFTIWRENTIGYVGLILIRLYLIFFMEFEQEIDFLFCEYVTQSQKHIVEKIDDRFKRKSIAKLSIIPEEKEGMSRVFHSQQGDESSKDWSYRNLYKTILLILPQCCMLLMLFSQILLYKSYLSAVMCLIIIVIFFYSVKFIEEKKVFRNGIKKLIKIYFGISVKIILFFTFFQSNNTQVSLRSGVTLLCLGFFYFMYLVENVQKEKHPVYLISKTFRVLFMESRCTEALMYWEIKSQFVSELGSQIHNQKKLLKLQKFYISKQKVSRRVQKLIEDIQQRGRMNFRKNYSAADFDIIDQIIDYKDEGTNYELFSNMLLILSLQDLQYCLQLMNHYYRPCIEKRNYLLKSSRSHMLGNSEGDINDMITQEMKEIRHNVLQTYHGSIYLAFKQYKHSLHEEMQKNNEHSFMHQSDKEQSEFSQDQEMVNLQKAEFLNQKYNKCMERIHEKSMEINWLWRKIIQNSEIISMVIVTGWNFFGGVYAIPANFAIFAWALVLQTKTTVLLWSFFFLYSGFIMIIKFILPHLPSLPVLNFIFYYYANHCFYEFIIILVSFLQIVLIKLGGTEYLTYSERESIYDAFYRKGLNKAAHKMQSELEPEFIEVYKTLSQPSKHSFFYRVFSKSRLKPGKDFYPLMSGIQLLILMYIFFFYDMMQFQSRNNRKSLGQILTVNQFSKHMMIILFTQVVIIILDRFIASLNLIDADNQALENFLLNFAFSDHIKYRAPQNVTHVGFFDFLLVVKYLFHIFLLILVNFFVYFYIPSSGFEKSLIPQCQNAICGKSYTFLSIFLLLYLAYFVVSGLQIKHGFSRDKCRNKLMEKHHWIDYYIYVLFTGIPFLWEFKKICDWTITTTALPLFHWMKFQDINSRLYQSKCEAQMLKIKPRAKTPLSKYFLGPTGCIFILCVVLSPLLLYSSLNPFAVKDQVLGAQVRFNLLVNGSVQYKFFSTSHVVITQNLSEISQSYRNEFQIEQNLQSVINFQSNNDFYLKMSSYPDENFKISQPAIQKLSNRIGRAIKGQKYRFFDMVLLVKIIEKEGGQNQIEWARKRLDSKELQTFKEFILPSYLNNNSTNTTIMKQQTKYFKLQNFYSPIPGTIQKKTVCLITTNDGQYYELYTPDKLTNECNQIQGKDNQNPGVLLFYSSSTKYKLSFGLVTFYVTYVLLISRLFRVYLTGNLDNVIYEGCHLERMLILCDAVREARILENLYQEEYLYAFLVDLMRNPRTLKLISGQFTELRSNLPLQNSFSKKDSPYKATKIN